MSKPQKRGRRTPSGSKVPRFGPARRLRILLRAKRSKDSYTYRRLHALYMLTAGMSPTKVAEILAMARSTVYKVIDRYHEGGVRALDDRRRNNGQTKADDEFVDRVRQLLRGSPGDYGWCRPTWTRELLCLTMRREYRSRVSTSTMSRVLRKLGARLGRPRPVVNCWWPARRRDERLRQLRRIVENVDPRDVVYYEDEVDIHLNPKIGPDWTLPGQQRLVVTPGKNEKRYIAGSLNAHTGDMVWLEGTSKNSALFCDHMDQLMAKNPEARRVHVIADNYIIHKSKITQRRLQVYGDRLVLHFLPPYCPNANRIERKWQDLHAEVTRNHSCATMPALMARVRAHLNRVGRRLGPMRKTELRKAA